MRSTGKIACLLLASFSWGAAYSQQDATRPATAPQTVPQTVPQTAPPQSPLNTPGGKAQTGGSVNSATSQPESAPKRPTDFPPIVPAGRPVIGLVLEGGGALGLAHIGVLEWLEEHHIPIDRLAGTSMGALVGGLYAEGQTLPQINALATGGDFEHIFSVDSPYSDLNYRRRQDRRDLPQAIQFGLRDGVSLRNALLTDRPLDKFLREEFTAYNTSALSFDRMPIPFRCVATDLNDLEPLVFDGGPLPEAIRASIAIPGIFPPVEYHNHYLVDGAITDNLPTGVLKNDLHADLIIAVHLPDAALGRGDLSSIVGVFARAFTAGTAHNVQQSQKLADILITPALQQYSTVDYDKGAELVKAGYEAAARHSAQLLPYALNDAGWQAYLAARQARIRPRPGLLKALRIEGGTAGARRTVAASIKPLENLPIQANALSSALTRVEGGGTYLSNFQTFAPGQSDNLSATQAQGPDTGVLVSLNHVHNGPPFLLFGADLTAMNSNVTRTTFDFRLIDQDLGGFGSELRSDLRLGFLTQASLEYYRRLSDKGYFLQPHLGFLRQPVYLWSNQVRISSWLQQMAGGGLDFGRTVSRHTQLAAEWREQAVRWHLQLGNNTEPDLSGTAQTAVVHLVYDTAETGAVSPSGSHFDLSAGALYHTLASENAPLIQLSTDKTLSIGDDNIFGVAIDASSYLRRNVADPLRFSLGGPLRLSASSIDEYRGTDDYLIRAGYLRRVARLPSGLGHGIYTSFAYEAGEVWSPELPAFLREDVLSGLVAVTPLGVITFGGSLGDAGRRKIFFTVGRLF
ncbi:MAG: patatin-like phospholipase family protein [Acidobacteria bacterium]|nr:patatin-like phospholipase family protein [Acidobacteriota bacterium]